MSTAILGNPALWEPDDIIYASANGTVIATKGDWAIFSGQVVGAAHDAVIGSPAYKVSAAGVFLANNPVYDELGRSLNNSAIPILRRGVMRVSASGSGSALTIPLGAACYPDSTASGIVGTTGATGKGACWTTAPRQGISANPTGAIASGVAIVIGHPVGGDSGVGQIDIAFDVGGLAPDYF